jgi:hypothetical protein
MPKVWQHKGQPTLFWKHWWALMQEHQLAESEKNDSQHIAHFAA